MKISTIAFCMLFSFCTPLSQKRLTYEADSVTFQPPVPENL